MTPLDTWRMATAVVPRRTALKFLGLSALATTLAACSGKGTGGAGSVGALALGKFAAGTWTVSAPDAHYRSATITITDSGTWTGKFLTQDQDPHTSGGTWTLSAGTLHVTSDNSGGFDVNATASQVPDSVTGDASADFSWVFNPTASSDGRPSNTHASYNAKAKSLTLTRHGDDPRIPNQTITATRS